MDNIFLNELNKDMDINVCIVAGQERRYKIIDIYTDGLKLQYEHCIIKDGNDVTVSDILLIPFSTIKYIRIK